MADELKATTRRLTRFATVERPVEGSENTLPAEQRTGHCYS
jgi:hypothetical protein